MSQHKGVVENGQAWLSVFRSWFMNASRAEVLMALSQLRVDLANALISNVTEQDGKLQVTFSQSWLYHHQPSVASNNDMRKLFMEAVKEWLTQHETEAVKKEWNGFRFQTLNPDSLLYKYFLKQTSTTSIKFGDTVVDYTSEEIHEADEPSDDEEITKPSTTEIAEANSNIVVIVEPDEWSDKSFDVANCTKIEDNSNVLGLASELGVISQSDATNLQANLFGYQGLSVKKLGKKYNLRKVKVSTTSELQKKLANIEIPDFKSSKFEKLMYDNLDANRKKIIEALGIMTNGQLNTEVPVYPAQNGEDYIIVEMPEGVQLNPTPYSIRQSDAEHQDPTPDCGLEFWKDMTGPSEVKIFICPVKQLLQSAKLQQTSGHLASDLACQGWLPNGKPLNRATAAKEEYTHCIDRYKKLVKEGYGGPGETEPDSKNYWWLLLLIIPILALFIMIGKSMRKVDEQDAQTRQSDEPKPSPTEKQGNSSSQNASTGTREGTEQSSEQESDAEQEITL
jgi:hypothetical protein